MKFVRSGIFGLITVLLLVTFVPLKNVYAAPSLSVSSASVNQGSNTTVSVYINTGGGNVDLIEASLSYNASKVTCLGVGSTADFPVVAGSDTCSGGTINFTRGRSGNYGANGTVVTLTFRGDNVGAAVVNISSATTYDGGTPSATGGSGGTITVNSPPSAPQSPSGGSATNTSNPKTNTPTSSANSPVPNSTQATTTTPTEDKTPPQIQNLAISDITERTASVSWSTNEPATSVVEYGIAGNFGFNAAELSPKTAHKIVLDSNLLQRGITYNVRVKSIDIAGNVASSAVTSFQTTGYDIEIVVTDKNRKPVPGVRVSYKKSQAKSDTKGGVTFKNVAYGNQVFNLEYKGGKTNETLDIGQVFSDGSSKPQKFEVRAPQAQISPALKASLAIFAIFMVGGLIYRLIHGVSWRRSPHTDTVKSAVPVANMQHPAAKVSAEQDQIAQKLGSIPSAPVMKPGESISPQIDGDNEDDRTKVL